MLKIIILLVIAVGSGFISFANVSFMCEHYMNISLASNSMASWLVISIIIAVGLFCALKFNFLTRLGAYIFILEQVVFWFWSNKNISMSMHYILFIGAFLLAVTIYSFRTWLSKGGTGFPYIKYDYWVQFGVGVLPAFLLSLFGMLVGSLTSIESEGNPEIINAFYNGNLAKIHWLIAILGSLLAITLCSLVWYKLVGKFEKNIEDAKEFYERGRFYAPPEDVNVLSEFELAKIRYNFMDNTPITEKELKRRRDIRLKIAHPDNGDGDEEYTKQILEDYETLKKGIEVNA